MAEVVAISHSPRARAWESFKKNKPAYYSLWIVVGLAVVALLADFIAYNKPIVASYRGQVIFPIFRDYGERLLGLRLWEPELRNMKWRQAELDWAIWPVVRYAPEELDLRNVPAVGPFGEQVIASPSERHYLGTDNLGRDLLSGLIHGTRISLTVGLVSVGISALIGIFLGALAGYFGDTSLQVSRATLWLGLLGVFVGLYYGFYIRRYALGEALGESFFSFLGSLLVSFLIAAATATVIWLPSRLLKRTTWGGERVHLWVDIAVSRVIEIMISLPTTLLIFTVAAIAKPSLFLVMAVIGLTSWTGIARFTRGEMLKVRSLDYIQAARALGYPDWRIMFLHALPNSLAPVLVSIAFGIASAILVESGLSFLGIGVPPTTVTWGSLLSAARSATGAWWLAVFPGMAIFSVVTIFNLLGEGIRDAIDPRLQER
ncbi:MAG: ABC transporter permease [Bacteroidia bacterium]|nr:ABC transporter permease [Bacteroidia bacterium]MCX7652132.1 ABC transporter permease [Bacteroidia bacterium]MDW8416919.1 ABC transporter permease [Bacteroidia bacterium]